MFIQLLLQTNIFQAVLVTNGLMSFVMFNYGDLSWTTGVLDGGDAVTGLGGNWTGVSITTRFNFSNNSCTLSFMSLYPTPRSLSPNFTTMAAHFIIIIIIGSLIASVTKLKLEHRCITIVSLVNSTIN